MVTSGQHDYRQFFVDQRVRPMFQLSCGITFGVSVGNLFELERSFSGDRVMDAASQIKKFFRLDLLCPRISQRDRPRRADCGRWLGELQEPLQIGARDFGGHTASFACQEQCHQIKHGDLRGETLGGGHGEFGTGSGNQSGAGFTRYGRIGDIGDGDGLNPRVSASRCAAMVSAVSPDWVTTMTMGATAA